MFFRQRKDNNSAARDSLVQELLEVDEAERPRLIDRAVREGRLRQQDAADVAWLVARLESAVGSGPEPEIDVPERAVPGRRTAAA